MNFMMSGNEWFTLGAAVLSVCLFLCVRKHFHPAVILLLWLFITSLVETFDYALAATPFRLYFCGDNQSYEISGAMLALFVYPAYAYLFLYFYDKWKLRSAKLFIYILAWTAFSLAIEWLFDRFGVFHYTGWKLAYSALVYVFSDCVLLWVYRFILRHLPPNVPQSP